MTLMSQLVMGNDSNDAVRTLPHPTALSPVVECLRTLEFKRRI